MNSFHKSLTASFLLTISNLLTLTSSSTFTFINKCDYTVWPGILASSGSPKLDSTGFELQKSKTRTFQAPPGWSGRFWGRTNCNSDQSGKFSCSTADCGSNQIECNGAGAAPPATLAEFTLSGPSSPQDFYDVSLVDGYNIPLIIQPNGGSGTCGSTGCVTDLNKRCPNELKSNDGDGCRSACEAFGTDEYCCSGEFGNPGTCKPSVYSQMFKSVCPKSYSYAYDDGTSTFTCNGADDYSIIFCPGSLTIEKMPAVEVSDDGKDVAGRLIADGSWLAKMATGGCERRSFDFGVLIVSFVVLRLVRF